MPPTNLLILFITFLSWSPLSVLAQPKRGLAFNYPSTTVLNLHGTGSKVNWAYNWDSYMDNTFPEYLEFVPMLWGPIPDHVNSVS